jgi:hypothetical protein
MNTFIFTVRSVILQDSAHRTVRSSNECSLSAYWASGNGGTQDRRSDDPDEAL